MICPMPDSIVGCSGGASRQAAPISHCPGTHAHRRGSHSHSNRQPACGGHTSAPQRKDDGPCSSHLHRLRLLLSSFAGKPMLPVISDTQPHTADLLKQSMRNPAPSMHHFSYRTCPSAPDLCMLRMDHQHFENDPSCCSTPCATV